MTTTFRTPLNNAETTLNEALDDSETDITMTDASDLGTDGDCPFRFTIDDEIFEATGISGEVVTVATRGSIEGTAAAAHDINTPVYANLTAGALAAIHEAINALEVGGGGLLAAHSFTIKKFDAADWEIVEDGASAAVTMEFGLARLVAGFAAAEEASAGLKIYRDSARGYEPRYDADFGKDMEVEWLIAAETGLAYNHVWLLHDVYNRVFSGFDDKPDSKSWGIKLSAESIIAWLHNGTNQTEEDTQYNITRGQFHAIRCKFIAGVEMEVYLDNVLIYSTSSGTNYLPTGTLNDGSGMVMAALANNSASSNSSISVFRAYYSCEY